MRIHALRTGIIKVKKALDTAQTIPLVYLATHDHQTPQRLEERLTTADTSTAAVGIERRAYRDW